MPSPSIGSETIAARCESAHAHVAAALEAAAGDRAAPQVRDRAANLRRAHVVGAHDDDAPGSDRRGTRPACGRRPSSRRGCAAGRRCPAAPCASRRPGSPARRAAPPLSSAASSGRRSEAPTTAPQKRPARPRHGAGASRLPSSGIAAALDAVAERREHRRHDGDRAEHRDRDDDDRADAERGEDAVAGEQHAGHRDHHRQAGDDHGAARGRRGDRDRLARAAAASALLALAAQVEQRVVDSDGEADSSTTETPRRPSARRG